MTTARSRSARLAFLFGLSVLALGSPLYLLAFKLGWTRPRPVLFAALVGVLGLSLLAELVWTVVDTALRRRSIATGCAKGLLLAGALLVCAGGSLNWLMGLQGFMVLTEGDTIPLFGGRHLQGFSAGPLARPQDMQVTLRLLRVKLQRGAGARPLAEARLVVAGPGRGSRQLSVMGPRTEAAGVLRFHGGAFGFSPRIVILKDGKTLFDQTVPFLTERPGGAGYQFAGAFTVEKHALSARGTISLRSLDAELRGHPSLALEVRRAGELLGSGELAPGYFADLDHGYRIGFAGLKKWVELDISRVTYTGTMKLGAVLLLAGALIWPAAALFLRRRRS